MQTNTRHGYYYALIAVLLWSGFILVSHWGSIHSLGAYDIVAIRYLSCTAILLPLWWFKFRFNLLNIKLIIASLIGGLAYALFAFNGFQLTPASHAALLLPGLMPLFIIVLTALFTGEKQPLEKWLGIAIISLGVASLLWYKLGDAGATGHYYLIAAALCWAVFSVLIKHWQISAWQATVSLALITCAIYLPIYSLFLPKKISLIALPVLVPQIALQLVYQGIFATVIQVFCYARAVQIIGPASMGAMMALVPVLAGFSSIVFFSEPVQAEVIAGLLLVSIGAVLAHRRFLPQQNRLNLLSPAKQTS